VEITDGEREVSEGTLSFHHVSSNVKGWIRPGLQPRVIGADWVSETLDFVCVGKTDM
jgi:hypothetical protein